MKEVIKTNLNISKLIIDVAIFHKVKKFIYLSSASIYANYGNTKLINENSKKQPKTYYGKSKLFLEINYRRMYKT